MMQALMGVLLLVAQGSGDSQQSDLDRSDPHRQFDFWIGEWSVQNRHLQPDGSWRDGDVTRARITPVCGGKAVLEEWAGDFRGNFMNGFSLRAYDPSQEKWALLLSWTVDGQSSFGQLFGTFRHGRGEFLAPNDGRNLTRYSFSDGLPNTVRWDSARSTDGGQLWRTDWIMEFSRTRAAEEVTQDRLFDVAWTEGTVSPHAQARGLDWMIGSWTGVQTVETGAERDARLRCKLLNKDCLVVDVLEVRSGAADAGEDDWDERLAVRGFVPQRGSWESWCVAEDDTAIRRYLGAPQDGLAVFEYTDPVDGSTWREALVRVDDTHLQIELGRRAQGADGFEVVSRTELAREP